MPKPERSKGPNLYTYHKSKGRRRVVMSSVENTTVPSTIDSTTVKLLTYPIRVLLTSSIEVKASEPTWVTTA
jgi:hypothetical protein